VPVHRQRDSPHSFESGGSAWANLNTPLLARIIFEAGRPYFDCLFGGEAAAERVVREWTQRESSELWLGRCRVLRAHDEVLGLTLTLDADELARCRLADALGIARSSASDRQQALQRVERLRHLFLPVPREAVYLSKIGVAEEHRGAGLGRQLLEDVLGQSAARAVHLDVSTDNQTALRLYEDYGFRVAEVRHAAPLTYARMTLER